MKNRVMTLGEISVFIRNGVTIKQNNQEKSGYPITRIETISDGTIDQNRMGYAGIFGKEKYRNWFLENEDILISHINSEKHLGKSAIYFGDKEKIIHGMNLLCFRAKKEIVTSQYLYFYFKSLNYRKSIGKIVKKSVNQASFSIKDFRDIEINLPDIENQKEIVKKLETIYEILKLKEEQIKKISEFSKCLFFEMFGNSISNYYNWKEEKCINITSKIGSGSTPKGGNKSYKTEGISFIRSMNVHNIKFNYKDLAFIDEKQSKSLENVKVEIEDILLNITGASVARCCLVPENILPARVNQHVSIIRCKKDIVNPVFLCYQFTSKEYQELLWSIARSNGATREAITKQQEENLKVIIPPIELQNKFAKRIKLIEKSKFKIQQSIDETQKLFDSLMEKYFG